MTPLNKTATKTFLEIISDMTGENTYKKLDSESSFMPLSVEKLYTDDIGTRFSFAHYYRQNGDMMRDPDMEFIVTKTGQVFPCMFQMDAPPIYEESVFFDGGYKVRPRLQKSHAKFANTWMKNIKVQQGISA